MTNHCINYPWFQAYFNFYKYIFALHTFCVSFDCFPSIIFLFGIFLSFHLIFFPPNSQAENSSMLEVNKDQTRNCNLSKVRLFFFYQYKRLDTKHVHLKSKVFRRTYLDKLFNCRSSPWSCVFVLIWRHNSFNNLTAAWLHHEHDSKVWWMCDTVTDNAHTMAKISALGYIVTLIFLSFRKKVISNSHIFSLVVCIMSCKDHTFFHILNHLSCFHCN